LDFGIGVDADGLDVALADTEPKSMDFNSDGDGAGAADELDVMQADPDGDEDYASEGHEAKVGGEKTRAAKSNKNQFKQPTDSKWSTAYLELHSNSDTTASITTGVLSLMAAVAVVFVAGIVIVSTSKATQKSASFEEAQEKSPILGPVPITSRASSTLV
jgi:hypothetical protein